jgi:predicted ribosome-associated RNA-binding protein Tma20
VNRSHLNKSSRRKSFKGLEGKMSEKDFQLPETFLKVIRQDQDYSIFMLEGEKLIFFPA